MQQATTSTANRSAAFPTIIGIAAIVFALDQATKFLVVQHIPFRESWSLFPALSRLLKFTYISNTGAAFGMFPQLGTIFMLVAVFVVAGIVIYYDRLPIGNIWVRISLGLQLGGAMGNLVDRVLRGYVVDFVDIGFWPIFNIADISIVGGVVILAYCLWEDDNTNDSTQKLRAFSGGQGT